MAMGRKDKRSERSKIDATPPWERRKPPAATVTQGPFDISDEPDDDLVRIDLGALKVPVSELEMRVDVDENQQVSAITLANETGQLQLGAFAAPRTEGIWNDVRAEIAESVSAQGGVTADESDSEFGTALAGHLGAETGNLPVRFLGVDGPRWMLRAMLLGAPAVDDSARAPFLDVVRGVVVVRGTDPLPVRDAIPLRLPTDISEQIAAAQADEAEGTELPGAQDAQ